MVTSKPPRASVLRRARFALQRFLFGNANLAGLASALLGPLLLVFGVIGPGWLWITAALYAIGWLLGTALTPARTAFNQALNNQFTVEELRQHLEELIDKARPLLNADMNAVLGGTLVVGAVFIGLNMLSDLLYRLLDPRAKK